MADTEPLPKFTRDAYRPFYSRLGKLMHEFSLLEYWFLEMVRELSGVEKEIEGAIFPGLRANESKDLINRILDARGDRAAKDRVKPLLDQFGLINSMRNHILHWGMWSYGTPDLIVTNRHLAVSWASLKGYWLNQATLDAMVADIQKIVVLIPSALWPESELWNEKRSEAARARLRRKPWRYKPEPLNALEKPNQNTPVTRALPPRASRKKRP